MDVVPTCECPEQRKFRKGFDDLELMPQQLVRKLSTQRNRRKPVQTSGASARARARVLAPEVVLVNRVSPAPAVFIFSQAVVALTPNLQPVSR